jgi:hypothetical protein
VAGHCRNKVLNPVGVKNTKLNPGWIMMSAWGGWKISALEYARFLKYFDDVARISSPTAWPKFAIGGGAYYSIGVALRNASNL